MTEPIAIVGMACEYPEARSPTELWENALARRRAFRRIPTERLRAADYYSADALEPDKTYLAEAAFIEGYEFDRVGFKVAGSTFRSADMAHWLALDVASRALGHAGFPAAAGLPKEGTGVFLGNTLTGEFSRADVLRLRWPYVRRVVEEGLAREGWEIDRRKGFLDRLEESYKAPFPPVGEETLAGGLSNTIAGRICNHFDLKGGGYTVDGACASSLLAIAQGASGLATSEIDVALAGGVDLSIDPFEVVGFAKAQALAAGDMRVYDARSAGFLPGEGCGIVVLMRLADALAERRKVLAVLRGWGISSDGKGGITRPEVEGQVLALKRAYKRAGLGIDTVTYFEGHGTGTAVGDATELAALSRARRGANPIAPAAAIGSIKAQIGHTKAAAGAAGLIKATMALGAQVVPPTLGCEEPHPEFMSEQPALRVVPEGEPWPAREALRAGVSAMGFGGINAHLVIDANPPDRRLRIGPRARALLSAAQDCELLLLAGADAADLRRQVEHLLTFAARLSRSEVADLAACLERSLSEGPLRAAVVASSPSDLAARLEMLRSWIDAGVMSRIDPAGGVCIGSGSFAPRIGFLFPGQGSPAHVSGGTWRRRFEEVERLYGERELPSVDVQSTALAQPAIVLATAAGLRVLAALGIEAHVAIGHSLGELSALHWAGAFDVNALMRIARARGRAMVDLPDSDGAMVSLSAGEREVSDLLNGEPVVIAGLNAPRQTVVAGPEPALRSVVARALARGLQVKQLPVSHAFHSPLVAQAVPALGEALAREEFKAPMREVISSVTGARLCPDADLRALLLRQVTSPVRFQGAVEAVSAPVDLWIEVGPGRVLSGLLAEQARTAVVATDAGGPSLAGLLSAVAAAFALGAPVKHRALFEGRFTRPFDLNWHPRFFQNPCEQAPVTDCGERSEASPPRPVQSPPPVAPSPKSLPTGGALERFRTLVAQTAELPISAVSDSSRLLQDLHLNSIAVGQLVAEAARSMGLDAPLSPTNFADATLAEVAGALEEQAKIDGSSTATRRQDAISGVDSWVRFFTVGWAECARSGRPIAEPSSGWRVIAPGGLALAEEVSRAFERVGVGGGVVVCLPEFPDERHVGILLEGARALLEQAGHATKRFVLVQQGGGAAAFARSLHLEVAGVTTCVVDVPPGHSEAADRIVAEALAAEGYTEARFDAQSKRFVPRLRPFEVEDGPPAWPIGPADTLLVTGGGKGIAAECACALAQETGVRLGLVGRSNPASDRELANSLARLDSMGIPYQYAQADVTDLVALKAAIHLIEASLGPVTAILHAAGNNVPTRLEGLDEPEFLRTLAPKVQGLANLLGALPRGRLKLLASFGSIIAQTGMRGEAHYALANEWLARLTSKFAHKNPDCRCLTVEWSVWSGLGMGERLGRVEALARQGITPIAPEKGVALLRKLLARPLPEARVIVTGRFGEPPTLSLEPAELPPWRFLEQSRVHYPGVELVVEATLSAASDPYLDDHVFQGERLFPAVMGLEAMAQAAMALAQAAHPPIFEEVSFSRPVPVPRAGSVTIRLAALMRAPGRVEVILRSESTAFQADHFRAICRFADNAQALDNGHVPAAIPTISAPRLPLDPARDLYGGILFQRGRFRRLQSYTLLRAKECRAELAPGECATWFGEPEPDALVLAPEERIGSLTFASNGNPAPPPQHFEPVAALIPSPLVGEGRVGGSAVAVGPAQRLPAHLVLPDPGARDAAIHAVQACIPHQVILPIGIDRLEPVRENIKDPWYVHAHERFHEGDLFIYDLELSTSDGQVFERWHGLRLKSMGGKAYASPWPEPLVGTYLERLLEPILPGLDIAVVLERDATASRQDRSDRALKRALGGSASVHRVPDRKPVASSSAGVSASHAGTLTLAVAGPHAIGCDIEPVSARSLSTWRDLLGKEPFALAALIGREMGEDEHTAATRVWSAHECAKKAGIPAGTPLVAVRTRPHEPVVIAAGQFTVATFALAVRGEETPVVIALGAQKIKRFYEYRHVVGFEETNLLGNVYYVNHISWQGRCRELFLREHCPGVLRELERGLSLVTKQCSCEYMAEIAAFDEILVRMRLGKRTAHALGLVFEYWRKNGASEELVARGEQEVACYRREGTGLQPVPVPEPLREALRPYEEPSENGAAP
ncbi:MAG TPA: SDR family NAD(P)-dependent oxidoreductase [Isosphaeraceae bacterium]|nr:SDR family NAD(P)-dependent oxidoreductase [Isosphaeraceae bacterium]